SSCTRSAPSQASGLRPSASEPGRTPMQESRDRASSDGRAPLVASLLESARTKGRKMLCASPDHQLVHVQAAVCGPQNRQYQTSGTTCRIRVKWNYESPRRGAPTPERHFGEFHAGLGGWSLDGEPYTVAPGQRFDWFRVRQLGGRTNHWGRISLRFGPDDFRPRSKDGLGRSEE